MPEPEKDKTPPPAAPAAEKPAVPAAEPPTNPVEEPDAAESEELEPEDDGDMPPEGHEEFARHLDYAMKNHPCLKYMADQHAATMTTPTATNAAVPGTPPAPMPDKTKGPERMQRTTEGDVQKSVYQRQIDETKAEVAQLKHEKKLLRFEKVLNELADEGIMLDVAEELTEAGPLDEPGFEKHVARIRKNYSRGPVGGDLPNGAIDRDQGENPLEKHADEIIRYMRDNNIVGDGAFYKAAKALNYAK